MKPAFFAIIVLVVLGSQANAEGAAFETVGPLQTFDFDAPDGQYQVWDHQIACPVNALRATVHLTRYGTPTTEFQPGVNAYLINGTEKDGQFAKLGFHATTFHPPLLVTMVASGSKTKTQKLTLARQTGNADWFSFELRWTNDGVVRANVDGQIDTVSMKGAPEQIHVMGFSGAGEVRIQLGYFRTKNPKDPCRPLA